MPDIPEGSIIITPQQVYEKVMTLTESVNKLVVTAESDTTAADVAELKSRVRALEQKVWMAAGAAATLGSGLGSFLTARFGG